jgi:hypothetical protein
VVAIPKEVGLEGIGGRSKFGEGNDIHSVLHVVGMKVLHPSTDVGENAKKGSRGELDPQWYTHSREKRNKNWQFKTGTSGFILS